MDLVGLLKRPEGKTLEFKRDLSTPEDALKTIMAFAKPAKDFLAEFCRLEKEAEKVLAGLAQ